MRAEHHDMPRYAFLLFLVLTISACEVSFQAPVPPRGKQLKAFPKAYWGTFETTTQGPGKPAETVVVYADSLFFPQIPQTLSTQDYAIQLRTGAGWNFINVKHEFGHWVKAFKLLDEDRLVVGQFMHTLPSGEALSDYTAVSFPVRTPPDSNLVKRAVRQTLPCVRPTQKELKSMLASPLFVTDTLIRIAP